MSERSVPSCPDCNGAGVLRSEGDDADVNIGSVVELLRREDVEILCDGWRVFRNADDVWLHKGDHASRYDSLEEAAEALLVEVTDG